MHVVPSGEVDPARVMGGADDALKLVSNGQRGTDLLVETPYDEPPPPLDDLPFLPAVKGYRVVLAHPEHGPGFEHLHALHSAACRLQVTGVPAGPPARASRSHKPAIQLVRDGLATMLASAARAVGGGRLASLTGGVTMRHAS